MRLIVRKTVYLQKTILPMYIYEHKEWPHFSWNKERVGNNNYLKLFHISKNRRF